MRKYTEVARGSWGARGAALVATLALVAGCASSPKTYHVTAEATEPPPTPPLEAPAPADVGLRQDAPLTYVVKKGDTLWDIASHFLADPWQWPEIWVENQQVKNPHLIYPGDTLKLVWVNGRPGVTLSDDVNKLSPRIREESLEAAIPTIPLDAIRDFLSSPRLVTPDELKKAPYVLDFVDPHIVGGEDHEIYVRNLHRGSLTNYAVVRTGMKYVDPDSDEVLGWEAIPAGDAEVRDLGSSELPGVAVITKAQREVRKGDHLIKPDPTIYDANFYPHVPDQAVRGRILSVYDGVSQIGQYAVITVSKGKREGLEPGHVLSILQSSRVSRDPYTGRLVPLPDAYAGMALVFKVEDKVSYALVMKATREIHVLDVVAKPTPDQH